MRSFRFVLGLPLLAAAAVFFLLPQPTRAWVDDTRYLGPPLKVGAMTLWPVYSTAPPVDAGSFVDLRQAHDAGVAAISEKEDAEVEKVVVKNAGLSPILVKKGTLLDGGKQDREIAEDIVVGAGEEAEVDALCVEQDRWSGEKDFDVADCDAPAEIAVEKDQDEVWAKVRGRAGTAGIKQSSLVAQLGRTDAARYAAIRAHLVRHPAAVGYAFTVRGGRGAIRAYSNPRLLFGRLETIARTLAHEAAPADFDDDPAPALDARAIARLARGVARSPARVDGSHVFKSTQAADYTALDLNGTLISEEWTFWSAR
jgi:hypothetical protein